MRDLPSPAQGHTSLLLLGRTRPTCPHQAVAAAANLAWRLRAVPWTECRRGPSGIREERVFPGCGCPASVCTTTWGHGLDLGQEDNPPH